MTVEVEDFILGPTDNLQMAFVEMSWPFTWAYNVIKWRLSLASLPPFCAAFTMTLL